MRTLSLDGPWELRHEALSVIGEAGSRMTGTRISDWIPAQVPGEVHLDLLAAGLTEEPLFSTHAASCRWPESRSWWYRRSFTVTPELFAEEVLELVFDGLDYYAQVFVNGALVGEAENSFVDHAFDIKHQVALGENTVLVRLTVGTERAQDQRVGERTQENIYGNRQSFKGTPQLRKPQFSYGWDWVDTLPNIGIWRGVRVRGTHGACLWHVNCNTRELSSARDRCKLSIAVEVQNLHPFSEHSGALEFTVTAPDGRQWKAIGATFLPVGRTRIERSFEIEQPALWWPNTLGCQPLHAVSVTLTCNGEEVDRWEKRIGLRTVALDRAPLPEGHRFCIRVNGEDVFCRGGNWIPADAILARAGPDKLARLVAEAREANLTMLRVWGGGVYEAEAFYEACDAAGILVWQDFMFACAAYPDEDPAFQDKVRREAVAAVRRLAHHPAIVLWCANNENLLAFDEWWNKDLCYPRDRIESGGHCIYSQVLPEVCRQLDPDRPYWPGSPAGGAHPNSETEGDCHWWHNGTMNTEKSRRIRHEIYDECRSRFVSEYGVIGPCQRRSIESYLRPGELDVRHLAWRLHTNQFEKDTLAAALRHHYADPENLDLDAYIRYGQMFQAVLYGRSIEALRFRKGDADDDCAGALIWMYNDCWGETGWTPIDYFCRRKASFYWIRNACAPVRALVRQRGGNLVTRIVNDSLISRQVTLHHGWMRLDGTAREMQRGEVRLAPNRMTEVARTPLEGRETSRWMYAAYVEGSGVECLPATWLLAPFRELECAPPDIRVTRREQSITLTSSRYAHGVVLHDEGAALLSDNYFDLIPGVPKTIRWVGPGPVPEELAFQALVPQRET